MVKGEHRHLIIPGLSQVLRWIPTLSLFFFISCKSKHGTTNSATTETNKNETAVLKAVVSGSVTQTYPYCGGARPTKEILEEMAEPKPFPGKKFYVIKGEINSKTREVILDFTSDTEGNFSFSIEPGTYAIILEEQVKEPDASKYTSQFVKMDEECFKKWWEAPYYLLQVEKTEKPAKISGLIFNFNHRCFLSHDIPCLQYDGPQPP